MHKGLHAADWATLQSSDLLVGEKSVLSQKKNVSFLRAKTRDRGLQTVLVLSLSHRFEGRIGPKCRRFNFFQSFVTSTEAESAAEAESFFVVLSLPGEFPQPVKLKEAVKRINEA